MTIIQMTPEQWAAVEDNPIQRDTEQHAKKAVRNHLKNPSSAHKYVHAARLPSGKLVKLDGHTRSLLWGQGHLAAPDIVEVALHDVSTMQDVMSLYKHFDNPWSTENSTDRLFGAYRLHAVTPKNRLLRDGGIYSALNIIDQSGRRSVYDMVGQWKKELGMLDELAAPKQAMPSVLIAAALMTLRKYGPRALDFWSTYCAGGGTRIEGKSCGVDELTRIVADLRARGTLGSGSATVRRHQSGRAISCCDAWLNGRAFLRGAKVTQFNNYLDKTRRDR